MDVAFKNTTQPLSKGKLCQGRGKERHRVALLSSKGKPSGWVNLGRNGDLKNLGRSEDLKGKLGGTKTHRSCANTRLLAAGTRGGVSSSGHSGHWEIQESGPYCKALLPPLMEAFCTEIWDTYNFRNLPVH